MARHNVFVSEQSGEGFIGRQDALERVRSAIHGVHAGVGSTLIISGEAGMGKTALLRAALRGAGDVDLTWGTCVGGGKAPGYWPWTHALNGLVRIVGFDRARAAAGGDVGLLANLVPALGDNEHSDGSERTRLLLMDAATAWLRALAAQRPVVVVLDDLQWADESSLGLFELLANDPRAAPICLLAAFRTDEVAPADDGMLTSLVARSDHLKLTGLDLTATRSLIETVSDSLSHDTAESIYRRAGGHPFFTRELARSAADGLRDVPPAVRDAIGQRVNALTPSTQEVLRAAALSGLSISPDVVSMVTKRQLAEVDAAIAEAVDAAFVVVSDTEIRFVHDLFRETIADSVEHGTRPVLHLAIGEALEARGERGAHVAVAETARHFREAISCGGLDRAISATLRAAEADSSVLALPEAVLQLRQLRAKVADAGVTLADDLLVDVLLAEADLLARLGRSPDARGLIRAAREAADRSGDLARITSAALAAASLGSRFAARRDELIGELESALDAVAGAAPVLEASLTSVLARELQHSVPEQRERAGPLSERALHLGRATGDPDVLAACLLARHDVLWTPGTAETRAEIANELVALAHRSGDREGHANALLLLANALLESGSAAFRPALLSSLEIYEDLGQPRHLYTLETRRAFIALLAGDLDDAQRKIEEASELGDRLREPDTDNVRMSQRLELVRMRGVQEELTAFAQQAIAHWTGAPVHAHAVAAGFAARAGDLEAAHRYVAAVHDLGTWRLDRSYLWSVFVRELAFAAIALEDNALCAELLEELDPLAGSCGVNGAVVAFAGCHSHMAGRLKVALGDVEAARALFEQACDVYSLLGATHDLAEAGRSLSDLTARQEASASLRRNGPIWEVRFANKSASIVHSKGLQDIARLLERPGTDLHVLDLMGSAVSPSGSENVLDRVAAADYRRRLEELSEERVGAQRSGDATRLDLIDKEHEALLAELRAGTVLGGRERSFANHPTERARKAVTARIRDTIRRLEVTIPELGAHLDRCVITGVRCRYEGDERWRVKY